MGESLVASANDCGSISSGTAPNAVFPYLSARLSGGEASEFLTSP